MKIHAGHRIHPTRPSLLSPRAAAELDTVKLSGEKARRCPNPKEELVETMLAAGARDGIKPPSSAERETLIANLAQVDRGVLEWAVQQEVKLQVLHTGDKLLHTDALRNLKDQFEARINPSTVDAIHRHLEDLTARINTESNPKTRDNLRRQKREAMAEILTHNPCGGAVFTPAFQKILAPGLSKLPADPNETPTMEALALHHGARSEEERATFYQWMKKLNGERLDRALQETRLRKAELLKDRPEARTRWLERSLTRPETVPVDTTLHTLVVPDAHFYRDPEQDSVLLDRSDLLTLNGWQGKSKVVSSVESLDEPVRGQWIFLDGKKHLLIRNEAVGIDTPVHEIGHVVDMTVEKSDPEFYQGWKDQLERAYGLARVRGKRISNYAMANHREYLAEGFAAFYTTPGKLRDVDPTLYELVDTLVDRCCTLAGRDRALDRKLERLNPA